MSALLVVLICSALVAAQGRRTTAERRGPRALAVLELTPNGRARLVPITILDNGKFYDAGLYRATPRPMALEPETVYEATRTGESVGLFTVTGAQQIKGTWLGLGQWRANNVPEPPKQITVASPADAMDEPPVLRRPGSHPEGAPAQNPPDAKPPAETATAQEPPKAASVPEPEDSDRPVLRRGKPTKPEAEDSLPFDSSTTQSGSAVTAAKAAGGTNIEVLPAISDAHGPEARSYSMELGMDEQAKDRQAVLRLAYEAIRKFAAIRPQHKPAGEGALTDIDFHVFDVNTNNEPVLVLSANIPELAPSSPKPRVAGTTSGTRGSTAPAGPMRYFVTVVARVDMYGEVRQLFAQVTDSSRLDAYPRLQLIDAVDADGNGSGDLLFRQYHERGSTYVLYRVGMDRLWELFEGAQGVGDL